MSLLLLLVLAAAPQQAAETDGVRVTIRKEAFFSEGALDGVRRGKPVEIGRIVFPRPGWFLNGTVDAAEHSLWFVLSGRELRLAVRTAEGKELGGEAFWVEPPTSTLPSVETAAADGAVLVTLRCDELRLPFRFVLREAVEAAAKGVEVASGRILLRSDLGNPALAGALAKELDRSIDAHAALIGRPAPPGPFRVHVFAAEKTYQAVDKLVTGGRFQRNGAFASALTMQSYVWIVPRPEAGLTLRARTVILHEVGHLVAYATRPESQAWPAWFQEGLAEEGTFRALDGKDAEAFHADQLGRWRGAETVGSLPPLQDLLTRYAGSDLHGWYTSAYLYTKRVAGPEKLLPGLLERMEGERIQSRGALAALEFLDTKARPIWRTVRDEAMKGEAPPQVVSGHLDLGEGEWRISTAVDGPGRVLLPSTPCPAEGSLEASLAWEPAGGRQADFYLAYSPGRDSSQFLKIAILPRRIVLFRFFDDTWMEWGRQDFPEALAEGGGAWHALRIRWSAKGRMLSVLLDDARRADFTLKSHVPLEATCVGVGAYDSVVRIKGLRVR